jgi:hypothetical protein
VDLGFETIGNATVVCHDRGPVLVTDPWLGGSPYFGSWTQSHDIPEEQSAAISSARYAWVSHGHPDHLSLAGLRRLGAERVLLPDHVGGRIASFLRGEGYEVTVLADRVWYRLSDRIRVLSISDYNQDGILLIEVGDRLVIDVNDASDRGWGGFVRSIVRRYPVSYLLRLSGFGDADMINIFDDDGDRIPPTAEKREPVGTQIGRMMREVGATHFVPFSSMHRYQRADSAWAGRYTTTLTDYPIGFDGSANTLLPAFVRVDCAGDRVEPIDPPQRPVTIRDPSEFGDDWSESLETADLTAATAYFRSIEHLERHFDFVNLRVGGTDNVIALAGRGFTRGITFEVPRTSLMLAIEHEIFDDLLIGNFMRTTLHGKAELYPHFTPYVAKYADNGRAKSRGDLHRYFAAYARRAPFEYLQDRIERRSRDVVRSWLAGHEGMYRIARDGYHLVRGW